MRRIAVVTTGGDAPGMNAAIRGVVRIAGSKKFQVLGFRRGWEGLITNTFTHLTPRSMELQKSCDTKKILDPALLRLANLLAM